MPSLKENGILGHSLPYDDKQDFSGLGPGTGASVDGRGESVGTPLNLREPAPGQR
jgi:hypothetical protein